MKAVDLEFLPDVPELLSSLLKQWLQRVGI